MVDLLEISNWMNWVLSYGDVIKGDMSLVGPRPDMPGYADLLEGEDRLILTVRPGITGPATLKNIKMRKRSWRHNQIQSITMIRSFGKIKLK